MITSGLDKWYSWNLFRKLQNQINMVKIHSCAAINHSNSKGEVSYFFFLIFIQSFTCCHYDLLINLTLMSLSQVLHVSAVHTMPKAWKTKLKFPSELRHIFVIQLSLNFIFCWKCIQLALHKTLNHLWIFMILACIARSPIKFTLATIIFSSFNNQFWTFFS